MSNQEILTELHSIREELAGMRVLLGKKASQKTWVRSSEFMAQTGKSREQMKYILSVRPELGRKREGEGLQVNLKEYNRIYG